jgi:hypothetical protein
MFCYDARYAQDRPTAIDEGLQASGHLQVAIEYPQLAHALDNIHCHPVINDIIRFEATSALTNVIEFYVGRPQKQKMKLYNFIGLAK